MSLRESQELERMVIPSSLAEQTTPGSLLFNDTSSPVQQLELQDLDLDALELGGELSWQDPVDDSLVQRYDLYIAKVLSENRSCIEDGAEVVPYVYSHPDRTRWLPHVATGK
ncbi:unnamed protein product [Cladocopium goreaui]|uniref:Uncharacterized protein n=1 Tax=Cladocopium goreaui TaxID=2562237 RepID=A0A9P1C8K4_9DINO|nr:unnamed protein product [Cladocopium goreaui]